ncbi:DNA-binding response regulator [Mycetocola zhujimingii]|uniref:DNA-binding response regulator n=2 Tax=Mycetocola zhujimingii TaxID=2079792 RepID=A0A2U1TAI9_9MICO|nr:DNA-binding response regulator [Mycetocola zhujimingii]
MVANDETLIRRALSAFINDAHDMSVVGEARTGDIAVQLHSQLKPDVIVIGLPMSNEDGVDSIRRIRATDPSAKFLAVTAAFSGESTITALRAGAQGFVMRDEEPSAFLDRIRDVNDGSTVLSPDATRELIAFVIATPAKAQTDDLRPAEQLSEGELAVVRLLSQGLSNTEMAATLHLSEATVKMRFSKIMSKWNVRTRVHVLIRATRAGLVR